MAQFKVGDKVKVKAYNSNMFSGVFTVTEVVTTYGEHYYNLESIPSKYTLYVVSEELLELYIEQPKAPKTADEMFAELGYENFHSYDLRQIVGYHKTIQFTRYDVVFMVEAENCFTVSAFEDEETFMVIDMPLHKAIHKKLEELGWLL